MSQIEKIPDPQSRVYCANIARVLVREFPNEKRDYAIECAIAIEDAAHKYIDQICLHTCARDFGDPQYLAAYSSHMARILANMDKTSTVGSNYLADALLSGDLNPAEIGTMSSKQLSPGSTMAERELIQIQLGQRVEAAFSDTAICPKCNAKKSTIIHSQTSAMDELSTVKRRCLNCNYKF